jgi:AcrR family transcriptional regulator
MTGRLSPVRDARKLRSERRPQEVLDAARRIFSRLGYAAASVEEIAKEAGMAKGTINVHFKSKEEVFATVLVADLDYLTNQMIEGMSAATTFEERLTVFLNQRLPDPQRNKDFVRICFAEFEGPGSHSTINSQCIDKLFFRGVDFMRQCLEQAIAKGELREAPLVPAALTIFVLARGLFERHLRGWAHLTLEEDVAFTRSLIMDGLRK